MSRTFFDLSLQAFLERRFGVRAEIVEQPPEAPVPAIVSAYLYGGGCALYGTFSSARVVQLYNGPFSLKLDFSVHEDSAQIDLWELRAESVPRDAVAELTLLGDPRQYDLWHCSNHLEPSIVIQGE